MRFVPSCLLLLALAVGCGKSDPATTPAGASAPSASTLSFFVSSATSVTGNLGGITGADAICQRLATAVGAGARTWRAYLSVERDATNANQSTDARSRIGSGPWINANGATVARDLAELHARSGESTMFVDERGQRINGQWPASPQPNEHDILTGSTAEGRLMTGSTCSDWTSDAPTAVAQVGHSDGMGVGGSTAGANASWNSAHANQNCSNTAPRGGAGRIYCFARN